MIDPLLAAADAISSNSPKIKQYAQRQAERTISDEAQIAALEERVAQLENALLQQQPAAAPGLSMMMNG